MLKKGLLFLNFKKTFCFFLCIGSIHVVLGQEEDVIEDTSWKNYHFDVLGEAWIGIYSPEFYGDNFLSEAYDIGEGFILGISVLPDYKWYVSAQYSTFRGRVINTELVGVLDASRIHQFNVLGGYSFLEKQSRFSLKTGIGIGYVSLRNEKNFRRFVDDGFALLGESTVSYRVTKFLGVYASFQHQWYFLDITVPPNQRNFFRNPKMYTWSVGLKVTVL